MNSENKSEAPVRQPGRRTFLNLLLSTSIGASAVAILYPILNYLIPPKAGEPTTASVVAGKASELKNNSGVIFRFGNKPGILVRTPDGELRAFSAICTHLECTVQYKKDTSQIWCACHNGTYDLTGKNVSGPPPKPLEAYKVNLRGDEVVVSKG
ncbi:MAG: Rieske 2Fe-2S domain-containing protein [Acidobacteriia bacterium]|nr:Rieske 2Fe-2S domain-containing protein [Terriglobia bacterium]